MAVNVKKQSNKPARVQSTASMVLSGDRKFLAKIGLTQEQAKAKLKEYRKNIQIDAQAMERWYRTVSEER